MQGSNWALALQPNFSLETNNRQALLLIVYLDLGAGLGADAVVAISQGIFADLAKGYALCATR